MRIMMNLSMRLHKNLKLYLKIAICVLQDLQIFPGPGSYKTLLKNNTQREPASDSDVISWLLLRGSCLGFFSHLSPMTECDLDMEPK